MSLLRLLVLRVFITHPEPPLSRAGDVGQDIIETFFQRKFLRLIGGHHGIQYPKPGQCVCQGYMSAGIELVGNDEP